MGSFGATWQLGNNWTTFKVRSGERKVSFSISDASGRPVLGHVHVNREDKRDFCGSTNKPIRVSPGDEIYVGAMLGVCGNGETSGATTGTITATFTW